MAVVVGQIVSPLQLSTMFKQRQELQKNEKKYERIGMRYLEFEALNTTFGVTQPVMAPDQDTPCLWLQTIGQRFPHALHPGGQDHAIFLTSNNLPQVLFSIPRSQHSSHLQGIAIRPEWRRAADKRCNVPDGVAIVSERPVAPPPTRTRAVKPHRGA